jgi:hypothetical protein
VVREVGLVIVPLVSAHGTNAIFHYHAIQAWQVEATGEVNNVYA